MTSFKRGKLIRQYVVPFLVCLLLLAVLYFIYDPTKPSYWTSIAFALVTGFLAGVLTPIFFYIATGKTAQDIVSSEFSGILNRIYSEYAPRKVYPSSTKLNDQFNSDLSHALSRSSQYTFVGETAVHVAARILRREKENGPLRNVEVVLAYSKDDDFLNSEYSIYGSNLKQPLRGAILAAVLALQDLAKQTPIRTINLYILKESLGFRFESTDDLIFFTESPNSLSPNAYPPSYQVDRESILGRVSINTHTIGIAGILPCNLNKTTEDDLISALGFKVSKSDLTTAHKLKEKLKALSHA